MNTQELIKYIEETHWINLQDEEAKEHLMYGNYSQQEVDEMFNIWIPWHGWEKIKSMLKENAP